MVEKAINKTERFLDGCAASLRGMEKLDGAALKWVALITMLIDHMAAVFEMGPTSIEWLLSLPSSALMAEYIMRLIGRTAFPIFAFVLVEGFVYTHNRRKHLISLCVFALLAEYPFDMAFFKGDEMGGCNVIVTMAFGFAMLMVLEAIWKCQGSPVRREEAWGGAEGDLVLPSSPLGWLQMCVKLLLCAAVVAAVCVVTTAINSDYSWLGVLTILLFYLLRRWRFLACIAVYLLLGAFISYEWYAIGGIFLILCYNGKKGRQPKWLFYVFYPMHILILYWIRLAIFGA